MKNIKQGRKPQLILLSIISFLLFVTFAREVLDTNGFYIDTAVSQFVYSYRTPLLTDSMHLISFLGGEFILVATCIISVVMFLKGYKKEALLFFFIVTLGSALNIFIKYLLQVPRPTIDPVYVEKFYSFPSGHAMNSFIFYATVSYFVFHLTGNKKWGAIITVISSVLIILIGFSRVYLGVHFPSDVLAGFLAGFCWVVTAIVFSIPILSRKKR